MSIVTVSAVTQFASALRAQMNLGIDADKTGSASTNNGTQLLSKAVSSLDLSNAQYGTLLLKDTLHEQAQAFAVVTFQEQQLSSLNTHLVNIQNVVDELAITEPADTIAYAALVEELADREDQLSSFIGAQFHASEFNIGAVVNANLGVSSQTEILNLYENDQEGADIIGQMAAIEVNFTKIFDTLHNESTCSHCIALAQQNATLNEDEEPSYALDSNDNGTGAIVDVDGKATADTGDARLEPLRMSTQWDFAGATHLDGDGDPYLTYSYYDGDVAYPSVYNGSSSGPPATVSSVNSHGAGNEVALNSAFDAWDAVADFSFYEVEESGGEVGELRVAYTDLESGAQAFAYAPGNGLVNGDIWFEQDQVDIAGADDFGTDGIDEESSYYSNGTGSKPGFNYFAALHEIGHALGLSHPFDTGDDQSDGDDDLPLAQDSMRNTVMTYSQLDRNMILKFNNSGSSLPTYRIWASTPMLYDIEMMEHYYGVENDGATGNNTYSFGVSPQTIQTITDGGGIDTFDLSNQTRENIIDLTAGSLSSVGIYSVDDQVSDWATTLGTSTAAIQSVVDTMDGYASAANSYYSAYSRTALYTGEYNVGIASSTIIENAIGGIANDTITGNSSNNTIDGGAGDDLLEGNGGDDTIDGGAGTEDVLVFNDVRANYTITDLGGGSYRIAHNGGAGADGTDTFTNIEFLKFTDQTIAWPADTAATLPLTSGAQGASGSGSSYSGGSSSSSSSSGTLASVDVSSQSGATAAIATTDSVLETIANQLAAMGALQNRLTASISYLSSQSVMTEAAIGRIVDTDFSIEMAKLTKAMLLSEAANYVLSEAQLSKSNLLALMK